MTLSKIICFPIKFSSFSNMNSCYLHHALHENVMPFIESAILKTLVTPLSLTNLIWIDSFMKSFPEISVRDINLFYIR